MNLIIGCDHAGFALKQSLCAHFQKLGVILQDVGCDSIAAVDYPDFASRVALQVQKTTDKGIIICGSGVGSSIVANKFKGVRAAICHDPYSAKQGVEHDDMNVLALGARVIGISLAFLIVEEFLNAKFLKEERFVRRLDKALMIEKQNFK